MQDLEVVSVWFLCNIIFMFILFFFLVDYIQDASWLTDGDAFTPCFFFFFFFSFFFKKKKHHKEEKEEGQEQLQTRGQTEPAHWPLGDMREWEENPAHGSRQKKKRKGKNWTKKNKCAPLTLSKRAESHLVSSSRPLNLPNGPRLWSCSHTRMSKHETTGNPSNKYCWFLYLHECRCFFVFLLLCFLQILWQRKCPSWI